MHYTRHALRRARQRLGLSKRAACQLLRRAAKRWIYAGDGYGGAGRWAVQYASGSQTTFVVFVVRERTVLTVYRIMKRQHPEPSPIVLERDKTLVRVSELECEIVAVKGLAQACADQRDAAYAETQQLRADKAELQDQLTRSEIARAKAESRLEKLK